MDFNGWRMMGKSRMRANKREEENVSNTMC